MTFKENIHCHIPEEKWNKKEHEKCDADHADPELNNFCHEVVERDAERRRKLCDEKPAQLEDRLGLKWPYAPNNSHGGETMPQSSTVLDCIERCKNLETDCSKSDKSSELCEQQRRLCEAVCTYM